MRVGPAGWRSLVACAAFVATGAARPACAAEWRNTPSIALGATSDTNVRLSALDERSASNGALTVNTEVIGRGAGFDFRFKPEVRSLRYDDPRELDRDDAFATANLSLRAERSSWSLAGAYARESTLTSEFETTGFVEVDVERAQSSLVSGWDRPLGERGAIGVNATAVDVDYGEAFLSPLVDYVYRALSADYTRVTSERTSWRFATSRSLVESADLGTVTHNSTVDVTWIRQFTPALRGSIGAGAFDVESSGPFGAASSGSSLNFAIDRAWPLWSLRASGDRELRPDGRGTLVREDAVTFEAERRMSERLSVTAGLRAARAAIEGNSLGRNDYDYAQAGVTVQWRIAEQWALYAAVLERAQALPEVPRASGLVSVFSVSFRGR